MSTKTEAFQAVLPALQHMARFRGANREVVCRQRGVRTADLEAVVADVFGSWARVDEENLEEIASGLGVTVPPYQPPKPGYIGAVIEAERPPVRMGRPPKESSVGRRVTRAETPAAESTVERRASSAEKALKPSAATEPDSWIGYKLQVAKARTYLAIFEAIAECGWDQVRPVLEGEHGVRPDAFRKWKTKYFGVGELMGPKFNRFLGWLRTQAGSAAAEGGEQTTEDGASKKPVAGGLSTVDRKPASESPCSPANQPRTNRTEAPVDGQVLDSLADLEDWTEISRSEPRVDAVSSDSRPTRGLILAEHLLEQLGEPERVRLFVSPSKTRLALAFGSEGLPCLQSRRGLRIPVKDWAERVAGARQEWHVAELHTAGVVQLVLELNREGKAA